MPIDDYAKWRKEKEEHDKHLWSNMTDEEWEKERKRILKIQEAHFEK